MSQIFRLKQFSVQQNQSALKVGTDSTLLGAYVAHEAYPDIRQILDVGTGTGIIALMLAQQYHDAEIDAIEMDPLSAEEAEINFRNSPWSDRLNIHQADFMRYETSKRYQLIVCNPPYFTDTHSNSDERETVAKHMQSLPPEEFFSHCNTLLSDEENSKIITIISHSALQRFTKAAAQAQLYPHTQINVHPRLNQPTHRVITVWQRERVETIEHPLSIYAGTGRHDYTPEFATLLRPYLIIL